MLTFVAVAERYPNDRLLDEVSSFFRSAARDRLEFRDFNGAPVYVPDWGPTRGPLQGMSGVNYSFRSVLLIVARQAKQQVLNPRQSSGA